MSNRIQKEELERYLTPQLRQHVFEGIDFHFPASTKDRGWTNGITGPAALGEGEHGKFAVDLSTGAVKDHGSPFYTGDLYQAVQDVRRCSYPEALGWIAEQVGSAPEPAQKKPTRKRKKKIRPVPAAIAQKWNDALLNSDRPFEANLLRYLTEERGLVPEVIEFAGLGARRTSLPIKINGEWLEWNEWLIIPHTYGEDPITRYKLFAVDPETGGWKLDEAGKKIARSLGSVGLYDVLVKGLNADETEGPAVYAEGELDALLAAQHGIHALSETHGAGKTTAEIADAVAAHPVARERGLSVIYDADENKAGDKGAEKAAKLFAERGLDVSIAHIEGGRGRDVSDVLLEEGPEALRRIIAEAEPYQVQPDEPADEAPTVRQTEEPPQFRLTDYGNAECLDYHHGDDLRYCYPLKTWLAWNGVRWKKDEDGEVTRRAKSAVRHMRTQAAELTDKDSRERLWTHAKRSENQSRLSAMIGLAQSEEGIPVQPDELDRDDWMLNVQNGTVDLRRGKLLPHGRADLITKLAPVTYDEAASCPRWDSFLTEVFASDRELIQYVQRAAGYTLTGSTAEQCLFIQYGTGSNGKGTYNNLIMHVMGDYAQATRPELLLRRGRSGSASEGEAALRGARFISTSETGSGKKFDEATVKRLTGSDTIRARFLHANEFEFQPTHKLWLATNHKPIISDTDHAIWRRIHLVPFDVKFGPEEQDTELEDRLTSEASGILNWLVEGCLAWQQEGLKQAKAVREATAQYRNEMDVLAAFLDECCVTDMPEMSIGASRLYQAYEEWCRRTGEEAESQRGFGIRMRERGFDRERKNDGNYYKRIGLHTNRTNGSH